MREWEGSERHAHTQYSVLVKAQLGTQVADCSQNVVNQNLVRAALNHPQTAHFTD